MSRSHLPLGNHRGWATGCLRRARQHVLTTHHLHDTPPRHAMSEYDSLHRQCRTLESLFDTKLTSYARLASTVTRHPDDVEAGGSAERWRDLEIEVEELLQKVCQ